MVWYTREEIGWLAGIIDGEGWVGIAYNKQRGSLQLRIQVAMCCEKTIKVIRRIAGTGNIYARETQNKNKRSQFLWQCSSKNAVFVLKLIKDHVITKKDQVLVGLEFNEKCNSYVTLNKANDMIQILAWKFYDQTLELNKRGPK